MLLFSVLLVFVFLSAMGVALGLAAEFRLAANPMLGRLSPVGLEIAILSSSALGSGVLGMYGRT